ncbi:MAG: MFS transporter [Sporolactobacillus sp.]
MRRLFRYHHDLMYLLGSVLISQLGTWFTYMLMIVAIYNQSKNVLTTMVLTGSGMIAGLIGGQLAGVQVEKRDPGKILSLSDWTSGIIIALVFFLPMNVWLYAAGSFLIAFVNTYREPAFEKYLVANVKSDGRMEANASFQTGKQAVQIIGPALAVFILGLLPLGLKKLGFWVDAVSYFTAALLLLRLKRGDHSLDEPIDKVEKQSFFKIWKQGLAPLKNILMINVFIVFLLMLWGISGMDVMLTAHVSDSRISAYQVGYVLGALSCGLLATALLASRWVRHWPLQLQLGASGLAMGLSLALVGFGTTLVAMMAAAFLMGIFNAIFNMSSSTFWQSRIPYDQMGRFVGFVSSIISTVQLIGMGTNGLLSEWLGAGHAMMLSGLLIAFAGTLLIVNLSVLKKQPERSVGGNVL